jgi:hypothetical protein
VWTLQPHINEDTTMSKKTTKTSKPVSKKTGKHAVQVAAQAEPVAVVTTVAPAAEATAAAVTVAPVAKPVKVAKVKAPVVPRIERNGVKRPKAGGACARVWDHLDAHGDMSVADIKAWAATEGLSPGNAACEIYLWRKFSGIAKAVKAPKQVEAVPQSA